MSSMYSRNITVRKYSLRLGKLSNLTFVLNVERYIPNGK